ncbi:hypothetical protein ABPG74_007978 [Tetrahymena malaccensis]
MTSQSEQFGCINSKRSFESQNYLSGNILCITNDFSIEPTKYKQVPNKLVYKILIKEDFLTQNNLDNTIQKKTQAFVHRVTKQQNLSCKYQSVFNNLSNQIALVLNSDSTFQQKNNESLSSQNQNDIQLNKQSLEIQDLQNNAKQEFEKVILISKEGLNQNFDQIKECILDQLSSQKEIQKYVETQNQKENCFEKEYTIKQLVIESKFSDQFNQQNVQAYQDDSLSLNDNQNVNTEYLNDVDEDIQFRQYFTELMSQIQFDLSKKNYYLTELVDSSEYEDMYTGYQNKDSSQILLFKLFYYPSQQNKQIYRQNKDFENKQSKLIDLTDLQYQQIMYQDVEKLIMVIEWYEKSSLKSDRIIYVSNQAKILVMKQDNYNQILNKCKSDNLTDFKADVFSLGKTFLDIIQVYKQQSKQKTFITNFENLIKKKMANDKVEERSNCIELHKDILKIINQLNSNEFFKQYLSNINNILDQLPENNDKDIPYFTQLSLYYSQTALDISQNKYLNIFDTQSDTQKNIISKYFQKVSLCQEKLCKYQQSFESQIESYQIISSIYQVANCYANLSLYGKALDFSLQSLDMQKQIYQGNHSEISSCLFLVSKCYGHLSQFDKALDFSLQSLHMYKQIYQGNHSEISSCLFQVADCYGNLGESYRYLGINEESQRFLKEYLETINKIKLTKQQELQYLSQAIICYQSLNQFDIALEISEKYLLMNKSLLNQNPLEVFKSLYQVGECYKYLNKNEQALDFFNKSLEISQNIFKEENLKISKALIQIGACYFQLKNYKKALMFSLQSLEMNRKIFKKGHPYISQCLYKISECYSYQNDYQKALLFSLKSLDIYKKFFEEDHQEVQKVNEQISKCYQHIK